MKKIFQKIIIYFTILLLVCFPIIPTFADSGFDGSYDNGTSSSGWSGSSSSSSGSDSSSSSGGGSSSSQGSTGYQHGDIDNFFTILIGLSVVFIFMTTFLIIINSFLCKESQKKIASDPSSIKPYNKNIILQVLPDFDESIFLNHVYNIYKTVQIAWMNFDYDTLKKYTTETLYNTYTSQLETLKIKNEQNIMKDFELIKVNIDGMNIQNNVVYIRVHMLLSCFDYISKPSGEIIRGNDKRKVVYEYSMIFTRTICDAPNKCPNCGAQLDNANSTTCPYCRSYIVNNNYDWILYGKKVIAQTENFKN